jgi:septum site-determining protein MinC
MATALKAGLGEAPETVAHSTRVPAPAAPAAAVEVAAVRANAAADASKAEPAADAEQPAAAAAATMIIDKPLRSGQQVYARGGDLVVMAAVNFGAEVIADGSIHVYAPLRGKAIAGARGNTAARIISTCMEPELISIAGTYRTTDNPLPAEVIGRPAQIRLDGERLVYEPLT